MTGRGGAPAPPSVPPTRRAVQRPRCHVFGVEGGSRQTIYVIWGNMAQRNIAIVGRLGSPRLLEATEEMLSGLGHKVGLYKEYDALLDKQ